MNIGLNIQATVTFYKVIVISVGLYESEIVNERHFANPISAAAYKASLPTGLIAVIVEV